MNVIRLLASLILAMPNVSWCAASSSPDSSSQNKGERNAPVDERIERNRVFQFHKWMKEAEDALEEDNIKFASFSLRKALEYVPSSIPDPERLQRLKDRITNASKPVAVPLKSDGRTHVSVSTKVPPSRFRDKTVMLPPGTYMAVGRRLGYEDEYVQFRVSPDVSPLTVLVVCNMQKP